MTHYSEWMNFMSKIIPFAGFIRLNCVSHCFFPKTLAFFWQNHLRKRRVHSASRKPKPFTCEDRAIFGKQKIVDSNCTE